MTSLAAPLAFRPILVPRVWGGTALRNRSLEAPDGPIGESWEISDVDGHVSVTVGGEARLRDLVTRQPEALLGDAADPALPGRFPLLIKLLDTRETLSVQVHPDDEAAARIGGGAQGKTEAWYILDSAPDARIYLGVRPHVTRESFEQALADGQVPRVLNAIEPVPGQMISCPPGTIHAIGGGIRMIEIQQASDTTFRLYDWDRTGTDGRPRPLHLEHGLAVARWEMPPLPQPLSAEEGDGSRDLLMGCEKFFVERIRRFEAGREVRIAYEKSRYVIVVAVGGRVTIATSGGSMVRDAVSTALVPAAAGALTLSGSPDASALLVYRP